MPQLNFANHQPTLGANCFLAPDAWIIGHVSLGSNVSVFFGAVLRGDILPILVGNGTNIQEHAMLHTSSGRTACVVGDNVTVGHRAILHGCTVGSGSLIGMGATVLDEAEIGEQCLIGAHALVTCGTKIPARSLVLGSPAKIIRPLTNEELDDLTTSAVRYQQLGAEYQKII